MKQKRCGHCGQMCYVDDDRKDCPHCGSKLEGE